MYPLEGTRYILFDEMQYTENWELWMKVIYDSRKDIRLIATESASPVLEKGSADSGTGRWSVLKIPTMSFYEYCRLLDLDLPLLPDDLRLSELKSMSPAQLGDLMDQFTPLQNHFNRYLMIGGFPELVLSDDDAYAQRMLREDVVDKVIKRDVLSLFNIRSPLLMEKTVSLSVYELHGDFLTQQLRQKNWRTLLSQPLITTSRRWRCPISFIWQSQWMWAAKAL